MNAQPFNSLHLHNCFNSPDITQLFHLEIMHFKIFHKHTNVHVGGVCEGVGGVKDPFTPFQNIMTFWQKSLIHIFLKYSTLSVKGVRLTKEP